MYTDELLEEFQQEKEHYLRDYLSILLNRKGLIVTIAALCFLFTVLSTFSKTPIYTATTKVLIEKNLTGGNLEGLRMYMFYDPEFMATQFELIRSYHVAHRVVEALSLDTRHKDAFFHSSRFSFSPSGLFNKLFSFFINTNETSPGTVSEGASSGATSHLQTAKTDADRIAIMIQAGLTVAPVKDTKIVRISYSHEDPAIAAMVANAVVQAYIDETLDMKTSLTRYSLHWMTGKAEEERKKLESSEKALQKYMRDNDIVTVENKLAIYPQKLSQFSSELSSAQAKVKELEAIYHQIEKAGNKSSLIETIPLFAGNDVLQNLRERIYAAEQNIRELSKKFGYKHPTIIQAKAEKKLLLKEKKAELTRIIDSTKNAYELARTRITDLRQLIATTKNEIQDMNDRFIQYTIMKREVELNRSVYDALATSIKKENVTAQSQDIKIWVTAKAQPPRTPSRPNKKKALFQGLIFGLFAGVSFAFFLEYLDNTVKSERKIEERYNLSVLGSVEDLTDKNRSIETYIQENPLSPIAESYRLIRSGLLLSSPDHPPRTILVTSMMQQEGKTTTTGNLAHILSQNRKSVLIIDCDMRRPRQHSLFGVSNTYGLSNYLSGNIDDQQTLIQKTENDEICIIPSGPVPPNPAELLSSNNMITLLREEKQQFDFVLLDSPPVQQVTDSLMLGQLVDGTLIVVRAGKTTYDMLDSGLKKLNDSKTHILGFILNRLKMKNADRGYYGYYSYYSKGNASAAFHDKT